MDPFEGAEFTSEGGLFSTTVVGDLALVESVGKVDYTKDLAFCEFVPTCRDVGDAVELACRDFVEGAHVAYEAVLALVGGYVFLMGLGYDHAWRHEGARAWAYPTVGEEFRDDFLESG